jgi:hypothetical protein
VGVVADGGIKAAAPVMQRLCDLAERIAAGEDEAMSAGASSGAPNVIDDPAT